MFCFTLLLFKFFLLFVCLFFCTEESFVTVVTVLVSFVFYSFVFSYGCCEFVLESKPSIELLKQVTKDNKMTLIWTILARTEHYHLDFVRVSCQFDGM